MKKIITVLTVFVLFFASSPDLYAKRGCCSWHGGVSYCGSSGYYICNDGSRSPSCTCYNSYNPPVYVPIYTETKEQKDAKCNRKYSGTIYQYAGDKCVCPDGKPFNEILRKCIVDSQAVKNAKCDQKYPGTIYRQIDDMCVCPDAKPFNEKQWRCI